MGSKLLLIIIIIVVICVNHYRKWDRYKLSSPDRNIPIQYAYTIDEWRSLREEFDRRISSDWNAYKNNLITRAQYQERCQSVVQSIIPREYIGICPTLYRWGVLKAAKRMVREGYSPGMNDLAPWDRYELSHWEPECYYGHRPERQPHGRNGWKNCIPGDHTFLDLSPRPENLERMGCGMIRDGVWVPVEDPNANCYVYYSHFRTPNKKERQKAINYFVGRGYMSGYSGLVGEFGTLTKEEKARKYEFVIIDPDTGDIEKSAKCPIYWDPEFERYKSVQLQDPYKQGRNSMDKIMEEL